MKKQQPRRATPPPQQQKKKRPKSAKPRPVSVGEMLFDAAYLVVMPVLAAGCFLRAQAHPTDSDQRILGTLFGVSSAVLVLGDFLHVGSRIHEFFFGAAAAARRKIFGTLTLVGLGNLATNVTFTLYYVLAAFIWRRLCGGGGDAAVAALVAVAVFRCAVFVVPGNRWNILANYPRSLWRNIPLLAQGFGVSLLLLLRSGNVLLAKQIGTCLLLSNISYVPVALWIHRFPLLGMLMAPKTVLYVLVAIFEFRAL